MKYEIMYEVVPPTKRAGQKYFDKVVNEVVESISRMKSVNTLNIPEIVDENYCGMPYYRNIDNREFGKILRDRTGKDILVNKVAVYFNPKEKFNEWIDEAVNKFGIKKFIFVGGTYPIPYPGPTVLEANNIANSKGLRFGNIVIPTRPNEALGLANKTKSGCKFFTSQILFEADNIVKVIKEYAELCRRDNIKPATFYLSFAPLSDINDIEFLKWLGAFIGKNTESRLVDATDRGKESVKLAREIFMDVVNNTSDARVPLALNVEQVSFHNLELSEELVEIFSRV